MRLLADENVPAGLVALLRRAGHDVAEARRGSSDPDIVARSSSEGRVLLTLDKDFANVLQYPPRSTKGLILLRIHPPIIEEMLRALEPLLARTTQEGFAGSLFTVDREGIRVHE